jgi:hypothetical protein
METIYYHDIIVSCRTSPDREQNPGIRGDRVLDIRSKLRSGKYNIAKHLDIVVDRLLEDILVRKPENQADFH